MTRVVHLTSAHQRYDQRILWRECCSLRAHGYDVTLIVNDNQENEMLDNGIKILSTGFVPQGRWQRMTGGVKRVYELGLAEDADIYHLHDAELLTIALKLKKHGKKVIFDSHEVYGEVIKGREWIPITLRKGLSAAYNIYETYISKRIDAVIQVGKYDGKDWFSGRSRRLACVGNYPRRDEFRGLQIPPYQERNGICFTGGLSRFAGVLAILEAADKANVNLILAGRFLTESFQKEVEDHDVHHVLRYAGVLEHTKIFELYGKCAVGMCVYLDTGGQSAKLENFNTKVYEYMSMELPVILSDWPYNRKMINKYNFGLVANPNNTDDIAEKIVWLLEHPKEAENMGKNGKRLLKEQFTWDVAEKELVKLYREVENS